MSTSVAVIDTKVRLRWELPREDFDKCVFGKSVLSPNFLVKQNNQESKWAIRVYPKGKTENNRNRVTVCLLNKHYLEHTASYDIAVETRNGYWPSDDVKDLYAMNGQRKIIVFESNLSGNIPWGRVLCSTQDFSQRFQDDKIVVVATLVIYNKGAEYLSHKTATEDYVTNVRSVLDLDSLSNITIVCQGKRFNCHKTVLASMSTFFRDKFTHNSKDKNAKVIKIDDSASELVEQMINFMSDGFIPDDIKETAGELIKMSTSYGIETLTKVCETALIKNLSSENVINTYLLFDKYVPTSEYRKNIIDFIKVERKKVVKSGDWMMFCKDHPNLVAEILEAF